MGQYLGLGIATNIKIDKRSSMFTITTEEITRELKNRLDVSLYDIEESERYITLELKKSVLLDNLKDFLLEQLNLSNTPIENMEIFEILESKDEKRLFAELDRRRWHELQLSAGYSYYLTGGADVQYKFHSLVFFVNGKCDMECSYSLFDYLCNSIKKSSNNILKGTLCPALQ